VSRVGRLPIEVTNNLKVNITDGKIEISNGKDSLLLDIPSVIDVKFKNNTITVSRKEETKEAKALHGTIRALINNMVIGLTKGFTKNLELVGIGYKAEVKGNELVLNLGYSHPVIYKIPEGINIKVEKNTKVIVSGIDKQKVGQVAAEIRAFRKPEPYKGKGIRYEGEYIMMKAGKRSK